MERKLRGAEQVTRLASLRSADSTASKLINNSLKRSLHSVFITSASGDWSNCKLETEVVSILNTEFFAIIP